MKVRLLGTGTAEPSLERASSSYLVTTGSRNILVDIGPSVVRRLLESGYHVNDMDAILLTHFHVDHTSDLPAFLFTSNYGIRSRTKPLMIIGGRGTQRFFRDFTKVYRWIKPANFDLTIKSLSSGTLVFDGLSIKTVSVNHNRESVAFRIEGKGSVVFSGDTGYSRNLVEIADGADLLIVECSVPTGKIKGHMNLEMVKKVVMAARPKRVILSHLYPEWENFRGVLPAPFLLGVDGMEIFVR